MTQVKGDVLFYHYHNTPPLYGVPQGSYSYLTGLCSSVACSNVMGGRVTTHSSGHMLVILRHYILVTE